MTEFFDQYKKTMEKVRIRNAFEAETIALLENVNTEGVKWQKAHSYKFAKAVAGFVIVLCIGTGGIALANGWDLSEVINAVFKDEVTADKVEKATYQKMAAQVTNENIAMKCLGAAGDKETCILLVELDIKNAVTEGSERIGAILKTYDDTVNPEDYGGIKYEAVKIESGEETSRYMLEYEVPKAFADYSMSENKEIVVAMDALILNYGEAETYQYLDDMKLTLELTDEFMSASRTMEVNQSMDIQGRKVWIEYITISEYQTEVGIRFSAEGAEDAWQYWKSVIWDYVIDEKNDYQYVYNEDYLKLYHNGSSVGFAEDYRDYLPGPVNRDADFETAGEYAGSIFLEPISYEEGDVLVVRYGEQVVVKSK